MLELRHRPWSLLCLLLLVFRAWRLRVPRLARRRWPVRNCRGAFCPSGKLASRFPVCGGRVGPFPRPCRNRIACKCGAWIQFVACVPGCQDAGEPVGNRQVCGELNLRCSASGVFFGFGKMKRMRHDFNAPGRRLGACVCLVAVMLLWSPLWASALQAAGMGCCDGAMCPLHGHGPKKSSSDANSAMDMPMASCDHHARKAAMDCSVACCHPKDPAMTGPIVFVLPSPMALSAPLLIAPPTPIPFSSASSVVFDPASPPPRTNLLSL